MRALPSQCTSMCAARRFLASLSEHSHRGAFPIASQVAGGDTKAGLALHDTMRMMPYEFQTVNMGMCAQVTLTALSGGERDAAWPCCAMHRRCCFREVAVVAAFLVASGTKGKRFALPNSRFRMENPRVDPIYDSDGNPQVRIMQSSFSHLADPQGTSNPAMAPSSGKILSMIVMQATEMRLEVCEVLRDKKRMIEGLAEFTGRSVDLLTEDFKRDFYLTADEAFEYGLVDKVLVPKRKGDVVLSKM
eukprot:scaffold120924_cov39-Tisochrysis_lutea.AAC.2